MRSDISDKTLVCKGRSESYWGKKTAPEKGPESLRPQEVPQGNLTEEPAKTKKKVEKHV